MHRIIYTSSRRDDTNELGFSAEFQCIASTAKQRNETIGVTGFLICTPKWFCQVLEGEQKSVSNLADKIRLDKRHYDFTIISHCTNVDRAFGEWSMAWQYQTIDNRIEFLERNLVLPKQPSFGQAEALFDLAKTLAERQRLH